LFSEDAVVGYMRIRLASKADTKNEGLYAMTAKLISKELELAHSIAELAYQNEQISRKQRELQEVINLKNNILSVTTHDLKNPIAAIQGFTDLLQDNIRAGNIVEEESEAFMKNIRKGITNVSELVQQLNEVALLELNQLEIQSVTVDINWLLREEADLLKVQSDKKQQHFFVELSDLPIYVEVDLPKCKRIIFNIIGNAIKYTPERGTIRIWTESDQSICKIHVKDSGIGIPQNKIDSIFEPFRKLRSRGTSGEFSSGLGLFISNYLVRLFKGSIQVESEPGHGSTFSILLPVAKD
jgi:signal transduction histidine kinase